MRRERYKGHIVVARMSKVRSQPIWRASVFIDRLVNGEWQEVPIEPGVRGREFASEDSALAAALDLGRRYVDRLQCAMHDSVLMRNATQATESF